MMRLGIGSYSYVWSIGVPGYLSPASPLTVEQLLQKAVTHQVRVVQIADNLPLHELDSKRLAALAEQARELELELELGTCGIEKDHLTRYVRLATTVGAKLLRVVPDTSDRKVNTAQLIAALQSVLPCLIEEDVRLAIENHDRFASLELRRVMETLDSPCVGICLDTANSLGCGEGLETVLRHLADWVINLHIKDFHVRRLPHMKGFVVEGCAAGSGLLDIPALIDEVTRRGRATSAIIELWPPLLDSVEHSAALEEPWVAQSVRYLRAYLPD